MNTIEPAGDTWRALGLCLGTGQTPAWPAVLEPALCEAALRAGLGALLYARGAPDPDGRLRAVYLRNLARCEQGLASGSALWARLEADGIPCIPMRGPFVARHLYPDPATRGFLDLDLLVPFAARDRALASAHRAGWTPRRPGLSPRFYRAAHLHFPLRQPSTGLLCDLHWAVDHPFRHDPLRYGDVFAASRVLQIDAACRWRCMVPEHAFMFACAHALKELAPAAGSTGDLLAAAWTQGKLFALTDACLAAQAAANRWPATARAWDMEPAVARVHAALRRLRRGQPVPLPRIPPPAASRPGGIALCAGFRPRRLHDIRAYLLGPHPGLQGWRRRTVHAWRAACHLAAAGTVAAACLLVYRLRGASGGCRS
jgi:hypothetical protein